MGALYYKMQNGTVVPVGGYTQPTAWTALPLQSPASIYGTPFQAPQYRKVDDVVYVRGLVGLTGTVAVNTVLATLPVGFRPPIHLIFACGGYVAARTDTSVQVRVYSNGTIFPGEGNTSVYLSFDGIIFSTIA